MDTSKLKYRNIAISGRIATGTSTLAKNLSKVLGWNYINAGEIQRQYDRKHGIQENKQGAIARPDKHEREIEEMTKSMLATKNNLVYEAWLAGFIAREVKTTLKILVICSEESIRVDRIVNRDNVSVLQAKEYLKQRESENISKWKKLYGDYDFWDPTYFNLVIDTYSSGQLETLGKALDVLGYNGPLNGS